jgi:hypothetical protein
MLALALALLLGLGAWPVLAAPQWSPRMRIEDPRMTSRGVEPHAPVRAAPPRAPAAEAHRPTPPPAPPPASLLPQAPRMEAPARPMISPGEAAQRAQQINGGGRVLAVEPAENGYRVRVLKNGEVRSVYVPGG